MKFLTTIVIIILVNLVFFSVVPKEPRDVFFILLGKVFFGGVVGLITLSLVEMNEKK